VSKLDLDAIENRAKAATAGPWAWEATSRDDNAWCLGVTDPACEGQIEEREDEELPEVVEFIAESGTDGTYADAAFIAHARTDVPALVAEVRRLRAALARARARASASTHADALAAAAKGVG
jgi:hypothetical protein